MKPTLLVLAAGMGSRYGSLKQIDQLGPGGEKIIDYSCFDAQRAGFGKIVFVIRKDIEEDFKQIIINPLSKHIEVDYVFQELDALPSGINCPADRVKPWGTGHAVMVAQHVINEPFVVINADDFYGAEAFQTIANYLNNIDLTIKGQFCMVGYQLENTLSEHGFVSRGVCKTDSDDHLINITERTHIEKIDGTIRFEDDDSENNVLSPNTQVSMNFWGFTPDIFDNINQQFVEFAKNNISNLKSEFYIPTVVDQMVKNGEAKVKVLKSDSKWFGVTYQQDKPVVVGILKEFSEKGIYPSPLWK